jgi:hypothetical protein
VPGCEQTIKVNRCTTGTTSEKVCNSCSITQTCCGTEVCSAAEGGLCPKGDDGPGVPLPFLFQEFGGHDDAELRRLYVPTCSGRFIPLAQALKLAHMPSERPRS